MASIQAFPSNKRRSARLSGTNENHTIADLLKKDSAKSIKMAATPELKKHRRYPIQEALKIRSVHPNFQWIDLRRQDGYEGKQKT
jgi:hypothetical protein